MHLKKNIYIYQHVSPSHYISYLQIALSVYTICHITVVAPWKAKLLIWMPLQAYRFQGLEGGSETTRDVFEKEDIKKHTNGLFITANGNLVFLKTNTYIFWKKAHKNKTPF